MTKLNETANKIYGYLCEKINDGVPPSVREIATDLNIKSISTVHRYLKILEDEGYIEREFNQNRHIKLCALSSSDKIYRVPLLGTVTAGEPITAIQSIEDYIPFKTNKPLDTELFALKIRGESMINAGILDGDIVLVSRTSTAENGDIVVALIDDEATVKTFYKENGYIRLQPQNDNMEPIIVPDVKILGKVIFLMRNI